MARRFCSCRRSFASACCCSTTCALKARLRTEALIMNMTGSKKASLASAAVAEPDKTAFQTAKPDGMRVQVAVSRGPHRSAAHKSGATTRALSAIRFAPNCGNGPKAMSPAAPAARNAIIEAKSFWRSKVRKSLFVQRKITGAMTNMPAACLSHHVSENALKSGHGADPAKHRLLTPTAAPSITPDTTLIENFATVPGVLNASRPPHQILTR